ncbi:T9SS type A sorting domain-containing protein [Flavobacterium sp. DGU99]|uniref:T9SS type A sorting domain-containing protein n=2 Tax=Flavobacterium flavipallidum TaxID=3139140 RepID=A0ABU9HJY1_9FLAO
MKKITFIISFLVLFLMSANDLKAQVISSYFMGQNAWMPSFKYNGKFEVVAPKLTDAAIKMIRIGGTNYNKVPSGNDGLTYSQYDILINSVKSTGAEPIVQISHFLTYQSAKNLVYYLNVTKNYNIKYFCIGNEPDLEGVSSAAVKTYITTLAPAIRDITASAIIMGPECAWMNGGIYGNMLNDLLGGSQNVAGKDSKGRYYLDIITYHSYDRYSITEMEDRIIALKSLLTSINTTRTDKPLGWALTEFNTTSNNSQTAVPADFKVWSMYAGQFFAQVYGLGMKYGAFTVDAWATHEQSGARTGTDLGLFDAEPNYAGRSNYYHTMMLGKFIKYNYMPTSTNNGNIKVVSTYSTTTFGYQVLLMNNTATQYNTTVRLSNTAVTTNSTVVVKLLNGTLAKEFVTYVEPYGTRLLVFDQYGNLVENWRYCKTQSDANTGPVKVITANKLVLSSSGKSEVNNDMPDSKIGVYPNPVQFNSDFYINYDSNRGTQEVMIFDALGRKVYSKKAFSVSPFKISSNGEFKPGIYFVKIGNQQTKFLIQ